MAVLLRLTLAGMLGLIGLEGALRLLRSRHEGLRSVLHSSSEPIRYDEAGSLAELLGRTMLGYRPHTEFAGFVLNSRSLRTPEYEATAAPGTRRLVVLGDSFTFSSGGVPFEQHWPVLLGNRLRGLWENKVEVINLGYPAVGPRFERRMWQVEGRRLDPDVVLLALFPGNDLVEEQGREVLGTTHPGWSERVAGVSYLFRAARNLYRLKHGVQLGPQAPSVGELFASGGHALPDYRYDPEQPTFTETRYLKIQSELLAYHLRSRQALLDRLCEDVLGTVIGLGREVKQSGARFVVALVPAEFQVDGEVAAQVMAYSGTSAEQYDLDHARRLLSSRFSSAGFEVVDLLPAFRREAGRGRLYSLRNTHWNQDGTALAARVLAEHLMRVR